MGAFRSSVYTVDERFPGLYSCVLCQVELRTGSGGSQEGGAVPSDGVASSASVVGRSGLDVAGSVVSSSVVSVAGLMFSDTFVDRSVSLAGVEGRTVVAGNFIDGVRGKVRGRGSLSFGEDVAEGGARGVLHSDVVFEENGLQGFVEGRVVGEVDQEGRGGSLSGELGVG